MMLVDPHSISRISGADFMSHIRRFRLPRSVDLMHAATIAIGILYG